MFVVGAEPNLAIVLKSPAIGDQHVDTLIPITAPRAEHDDTAGLGSPSDKVALERAVVENRVRVPLRPHTVGIAERASRVSEFRPVLDRKTTLGEYWVQKFGFRSQSR